eukprot:1298688-Rhodomonas_salina.1
MVMGVKLSTAFWWPGKKGMPAWHVNMGSMFAYANGYTRLPGQNKAVADALRTFRLKSHPSEERA